VREVEDAIADDEVPSSEYRPNPAGLFEINRRFLRWCCLPWRREADSRKTRISQGHARMKRAEQPELTLKYEPYRLKPITPWKGHMYSIRTQDSIVYNIIYKKLLKCTSHLPNSISTIRCQFLQFIHIKNPPRSTLKEGTFSPTITQLHSVLFWAVRGQFLHYM
jgi:hypothetical protein